ncbi:MAG: hypothetical protein PWR24_905 [Desulfonauticus sp.]|jgi:predicted Zn-dependent protease|nr:hypothetical protein [Desulfonauticus sp.]
MFFKVKRKQLQEELPVDSEEKVVTGSELLFILGAFLLALFLVFPRKSLDFYVLSEQKNLDLAISYLEVLVKKYSRVDYARVLFQGYVHKGEWENAEKLGEKIKLSPFLRYDLSKSRFFALQNKEPEKAIAYLQKCLSLLKEIEIKEEVKPSWLYEEYWRLGQSAEALRIIENYGLYKEDVKWAKKGLELTLAKSDFKKAMFFLEELIVKDSPNSLFWKQKKAVLLEQEGKYLASAEIYFQLFKESKDKKQKKKFLISAFKVLESGNKVKEIKKYLHSYLKEIPGDYASYNYFLSLARKVGARKEAQFLSRKILREN